VALPLRTQPRARRPGGVRAALLVACLAVAAAAGQAPNGLDLTVREENGVYTVSARFHVPEPVAVVGEVLRDYNAIPRFMRRVRTSVVVEREPGRALVRQEAEARFLFFSRRLHLLLDVVETPGRIEFRDRSGQSFDRYEGSWQFSAANGGTDLSYTLVANPSSGVPGFILDRVFERDSEETMRHLREEIAERAGAGRRP
jgi:uncharacterized membrane protein